MDSGLRGWRALVTGGCSGIGRAVALAHAAEGADVAVAVPLRREAAPHEIASAVAFLLSERLAGYVTGTEPIVDGGLHLRPMFHGGHDALQALSTSEGASA